MCDEDESAGASARPPVALAHRVAWSTPDQARPSNGLRVAGGGPHVVDDGKVTDTMPEAVYLEMTLSEAAAALSPPTVVVWKRPPLQRHTRYREYGRVVGSCVRERGRRAGRTANDYVAGVEALRR